MDTEISITTDYIKLDQFLKLAGISPDGASAKVLILGGGVLVDDQKELRRGRKLYPGMKIKCEGQNFVVVSG